MELLDRYLKAVRLHLPSGQQDDIIRELADNLLSQMEDREAELGRKLTQDEQAEILRRLGDPVLVAGRYRQDAHSLVFGRQWIGPALFPFYLRVLGFNLGITLVVCVGIVVARLEPVRALGAVPAILLQLFLQFGIVTAIFIVAQRRWWGAAKTWDPRNPLFQGKGTGRARNVPREAPREVPRLESFSQLVAATVFLFWIIALQQSPALFPGERISGLAPGPVWQQIYPWAMLIVLVGMVQSAVNLIHPQWMRFRLAMRVLTGGMTLLVWQHLFHARDWLVLSDSNPAVAAHRAGAPDAFNQVFYFALIVIGVAVGVRLLIDLFRLVWGLGRDRGISSQTADTR